MAAKPQHEEKKEEGPDIMDEKHVAKEKVPEEATKESGVVSPPRPKLVRSASRPPSVRIAKLAENAVKAPERGIAMLRKKGEAYRKALGKPRLEPKRPLPYSCGYFNPHTTSVEKKSKDPFGLLFDKKECGWGRLAEEIEQVLHTLNNPDDLSKRRMNETGFKAIITSILKNYPSTFPEYKYHFYTEYKVEKGPRGPEIRAKCRHIDLIIVKEDRKEAKKTEAIECELKYIGAMYQIPHMRIQRKFKAKGFNSRSSREERACRLWNNRGAFSCLLNANHYPVDAIFTTAPDEKYDAKSKTYKKIQNPPRRVGDTCALAFQTFEGYGKLFFNRQEILPTNIMKIVLVGYDIWAAVAYRVRDVVKGTTTYPITDIACNWVDWESLHFDEQDEQEDLVRFTELKSRIPPRADAVESEDEDSEEESDDDKQEEDAEDADQPNTQSLYMPNDVE
jgi:hypothetical protein